MAVARRLKRAAWYGALSYTTAYCIVEHQWAILSLCTVAWMLTHMFKDEGKLT